MEYNNSNQISLLSGFNACNFNDNINASLSLFDKSLENKKQYNAFNANNFSETNESLLKTLNVIDFNIPNETSQKQETYTLEDLLDLEHGDLQQPETTQFFNTLEDEPLFSSSDVLMQTALPSPVSSSSDESCDLDELFFVDKSAVFNALQQPESPVFITNHQQQEQYVLDPQQQQQFKETQDSGIMLNGTDLSVLCSLLFQNSGIAALSSSEEESQLSTAPSSPASSLSSESDSERTTTSPSQSPRYKPYTKKKQKTPEQKTRKMAQNRTAANRYRVKKKDELKIMSKEADILEEKNKNLKGKVDGLRNEIDYLKNLMLDVIKARLTKGATPESLLADAAELMK